MHVNKFFALTLLLIDMIGAVSLEAAPRRQAYVDEGTQSTLRELRDGFNDIRHEMNNRASEIHVFEETLNTYEVTIDGLRQQLMDTVRTNQQYVREKNEQLDQRLNNLEANFRGIASDLQILKSHSQETATLVVRLKQKLDECEKVFETQNNNIENLQASLTSLTDVLQINKCDTSGSKTYKVKPGDSLERIARHQQTTIHAIKELNNLTNDKIIVGQTLKLP